MNAVALFAALFAERGRVVSAKYSSLPAYNHLLKSGLIEEGGIASGTLCDECDQLHDATVVFENKQYGYYCPDLGFISKDRSELFTARPNLSAFAAQIADHLGCKRRKSTPLEGDIWRIGAVDTLAGDVVLYLTPNMQDEQDLRSFQSALAGEMKSSFGIVLTSNGTLNAADYITARLQDILSFDPETRKFVVTEDLKAIAGVTELRNGGRPNGYTRPLTELSAAREREGRILKGRNEEAKALRVDFKARFPNEKCPSLSTVGKYVTKIRSGS